jgi:hypothetical protein
MVVNIASMNKIIFTINKYSGVTFKEVYDKNDRDYFKKLPSIKNMYDTKDSQRLNIELFLDYVNEKDKLNGIKTTRHKKQSDKNIESDNKLDESFYNDDPVNIPYTKPQESKISNIFKKSKTKKLVKNNSNKITPNDDFIKYYIHNTQNKQRIIKIFSQKFDDLLNKHKTINYSKFINEFDNIVNQTVKCNLEYDELLEHMFIMYINKLPKKQANDFVKSTYNHYHINYDDYYDTIWNNKNRLTIETLAFILHYHKHDFNKIFSELCNLLKNPKIWKKLKTSKYFDITAKTYLTLYNNNKFKSWFINDLLSDSHNDVQIIVKVAVTDVKLLKILDNKKAIPYNLLQKVNKNAPIILKYHLMNTNKIMLEESLFVIDDVKMNQFVTDYDHFDKYKDNNDEQIKIPDKIEPLNKKIDGYTIRKIIKFIIDILYAIYNGLLKFGV